MRDYYEIVVRFYDKNLELEVNTNDGDSGEIAGKLDALIDESVGDQIGRLASIQIVRHAGKDSGNAWDWSEDRAICASCHERFDSSIGGHYSDAMGVELCDGCYESELGDHVSTLVRYSPDNGMERVRFGDLIAEDENGEVPNWFLAIYKGRKYVHTDAWRGYYDTKFKGLVEITQGWLTGYPDHTVSYKTYAEKLQEALKTSPPPVSVYWLFEPTSNVFSTASSVLVERGNVGKFKAWLKKVSVDAEKLNQSFA